MGEKTVPFDVTIAANALGAPVLHTAETDSTMEDARNLAARGFPSGTVICADYQRAGRGRIEGRVWNSPAGENLLCTVLLRGVSALGLTLRVGLAVARAFDAFLVPNGLGETAIKWPNDVLYRGKKLAGILCESDGAEILVGTGFNLGQNSFPEEISGKATSLALALSGESRAPLPSREAFLTEYLAQLAAALDLDAWHEAISRKLLWRGERITFLAGDPARRETLDGVIEGIGPSGELLFRSASPLPTASSYRTDENGVTRLWSGEIPYPTDSSRSG